MTMHNSVRAQLAEVFEAKQADVLANVVTEAYDKLVTKSDLYELRVVVREIADNQKITDERLAKLAENTERRFAQTDGRIDRMADSIDRLTGRVDQLAVGQDKLTGRMEQLAIGQDKLTGRMDQLAVSQEKLTNQVRKLAIGQDELVGPVYEGKVAAHLYAYVGDTVDHCVVLDSRGKARFFAHLDPNGTLEPSEISDLRRADIFATGRIDGEAVVLLVEVSRTSDKYDIARTARRAAILAKTGARAIPVVACLHVDFATRALAHEKGVWVIRKGRHLSEAG